MTLKEEKKEIKELLKAKKKDKLIEKLEKCFDKDKELEKEFEDMHYDTCFDLPKDEKEIFEKLPWSVGNSDYYYWASNLGRVAIGKEKADKIIPQCQDSEWNWKLDKNNFYDKTIAGEIKVYDFMKETTWLKDEYEEIKKEYPNYCKFELHHICQKGDNRIDNMIYLPECFHNELHHPNIKK